MQVLKPIEFTHHIQCEPTPLPHFSLSGTSVTVLNGPVQALDRDIGMNTVVKYKLLGSRVDLFTIDADTGDIASHCIRLFI